MGVAWRHPNHAGPHAAGWRIHPWMGEPMTWVQTCHACQGTPGRILTRQANGQHAFTVCPACHGHTWQLKVAA